MVLCEVCTNHPTTSSKTSYNDCITECLEKIKIHYNWYKENFDDNKITSQILKLENEDLQKRIKQLEEKLSTVNNSPQRKRSKTHSSFASDTSDIDLDDSKNTSSLSKVSGEIENDLNQAMDITDVDWSESFFTTQKINKTPKKLFNEEKISENTSSNSTPRKILSPINKNNDDSSCSSLNRTPLPRRLKLKTETHNENQIPVNSSKWITSKDNRNSGTSFIKVQKTSSVLSKNDKSPGNTKIFEKSKYEKLKISPQNNLSLKPSSKLRQTKLVFDITTEDKGKKTPDTDETFCDDFIGPSPSSFLSDMEEGSRIKKKNLSNFSRRKPISNLFTFASKKLRNRSNLEPSVNKIKIEPSTPESSLKNKKVVKSINQQNDSSSIVVLTNQPDDVIVIDNTDIDYNKFNANDLINEMIDAKSEILPTFCEAAENNKKIKEDNIEKYNKKKEIDEVLKSACPRCQEYFKFVGKHLSAEEIKLRLRNCKHKDMIIGNQTPEGFWDPIFRPFPDDDPRNETLIDELLLHKDN